MNQTKDNLEQTKEELHKCKNDKKHYIQNIVVGGYNQNNQVGAKPNNKDGNQFISPPIVLSFYHPQLLLYSVYGNHSVIYDGCNMLKGIGDNKDGRISSSLQQTDIENFTEFSIKDRSGLQLNPISAVVAGRGTLYMFSKIRSSQRELVLCDKDINSGDPVFLDIGNQQPVALFGGRYHLAAISSDFKIIYINRDSVVKSPQSRIEAISLPDEEKASSVACCTDSIVVLSSNGRVFSSPVEEGSNTLNFSEVVELKDKEIICVSGTSDHVLAVSKDGCVFGRGSNEYGKLGIGMERKSSSSFTKISIEGYKIKAAYAGGYHSLFETQEGKILSCGNNSYGQLLLSSGPVENAYQPIETMITEGATFCIAGWCLSAVFVDREPPPNNPNVQIIPK